MDSEMKYELPNRIEYLECVNNDGNCTINRTFFYDYKILATDYDSYAIYYACSDNGRLQLELQTKDVYPSDELKEHMVSVAREKVPEYDWANFIWVRFSDECTNLLHEESVSTFLQ